jgi:hypothetical protein
MIFILYIKILFVIILIQLIAKKQDIWEADILSAGEEMPRLFTKHRNILTRSEEQNTKT